MPDTEAASAMAADRSASGDEAAVLKASRALGAAAAQGSAPELARLLDADFMLIDGSGNLRPREGALAEPEPLRSDAAALCQTRAYGDIATLVRRSPAAGSGERVVLEVWVRDAGGWRAFILHDNLIADASDSPSHPPLKQRPADAPPPVCDNPLKSIPYEPKSADERDLLASFKALETAVTRNDPETWVGHVADEFMVFRTRQHPTSKAGRAQMLADQRAVNNETFVAAIAWMNLWVRGDAAVMRADHVMPGGRRPPYRATRSWVKRGGVWQMAISQQTTTAGSATA